MKLKEIRIDGYKNLIDCRLELGDFNVLVGPNNCGKTNLLEAVQMFFPVCFGSSKLKQDLFSGLTPRFIGSSVCHLDNYKNKPITIGVSFETTFERKRWNVDYQVSIQCRGINGGKEKFKVGFREEILRAKASKQTGPITKLIERSPDNPRRFTVTSKKGTKLVRRIDVTKSVIDSIETIFPSYEGLPKVLSKLIYCLTEISMSQVFAFSPDGLRNALEQETEIEILRIASFDLFLTVDELYKNKKLYNTFREAICDILDLDDLYFYATYTKKGKKRVRTLALKTKGAGHADIAEYSDGTLAATAVLSALFSKKREGPMLLVEELENCLHPAAIGKLLRFLQDNAHRWPVLITTHSPYVLNCVNPEDVNVAVPDKYGGWGFEKVRNKKRLRDYLKSGFMSFGELLASNFEEVLEKKK